MRREVSELLQETLTMRLSLRTHIYRRGSDILLLQEKAHNQLVAIASRVCTLAHSKQQFFAY